MLITKVFLQVEGRSMLQSGTVKLIEEFIYESQTAAA